MVKNNLFKIGFFCADSFSVKDIAASRKRQKTEG
jgi:hypothetical protein